MLITEYNRTGVFQNFLFLGIMGIAMTVVQQNTTPYMAAATGSFLMLTYGLIVRKQNIKLHSFLMLSAILLDIALVLILEVQRGAVETAVKVHITPGQYLHIGFSLLATLLYIPTLILGIFLMRGVGAREKILAWHKPIAIAAYSLRTLGFITMFTMLELVKRH